MNNIGQDVKYAFRGLHRNPWLSLTLIATLGLGVGGVVAIFSLINGILIQPLPFANSDRLFIIGGAAAPPDGDVLRWWSQSEAFENLCDYSAGGLNITEKENTSRLSVAIVSGSFFSVFSVTPQLGHIFDISEENADNNQVAVLSERLWVRNYNRSPNVVGQVIKLDGVVYTVIGVLPTGFGFPGQTDVWIPKSTGAYFDLGKDEQSEGHLPRFLRRGMIGRLKPQVSQAYAQSQLDALFARLKDISSKNGVNVGSGARLIPLQDFYSKNSKTLLWVLFVGAGLLLAISCVNTTSLILTRAAIRQTEIAMRLCLGATNLRVIRQLLIEGIVVALCSGVVGVWLAYILLDLVRAIWADTIPRLSEIRVNTSVLGGTLGLSIMVGLIINLAPAIKIRSVNITEVLKKGRGTASAAFGWRARHALIFIEIVLAQVLLIGSLLSIQTLFRLSNVEIGFDPRNVSTFELALPRAKYSILKQDTNKSQERQKMPRYSLASEFYQRLFEKIKTVPGIIAVGGVDRLPMNSTSGAVYLDLPEAKSIEALITNIAGDYFQALGVPLKVGRPFIERDAEGSNKVIIISESLARKYFATKNPIGQSLMIEGEKNTREIVGVVGDIRQIELDKEPKPQIYLPHSQPYREMPPTLNFVIVFRTNLRSPITNDLRNAVSSIDKDLPIFGVRPMDDVVFDSASTYRFRGILLGGFAVIALILSVIGVYGVVSYSVSSRTHEIGIRMSLGAKPHNILFTILREGLLLALLGVSIGIMISFGLNRYITSLLYGVSPTDKRTIILASLTLILSSLLACAIPAFIASKVNPSVALRQE